MKIVLILLIFVFVNRMDQSYAVATLANILGIEAKVAELHPFGYMKPLNLIGVGLCNNPVYLGEHTTNHIAVCGSDDASRSRFVRHRYVFAEGVIFDACAGPALGTQTQAEYLNSVIDHSTADEERHGYFSSEHPGSNTERSRVFQTE